MPNYYDKIFKENLDPLLPLIMKRFLGIDPQTLVPIDAKIQVTPEIEMDAIRRVVHANPALDYGLQLEFHVKNQDLRKRNFLHYAMFHHKTGLPLRQIVIYVGSDKATLIRRNRLRLIGHKSRFEVIVIKEIPAEHFLNSDTPEEILFAILGDYGAYSTDEIVRQILNRLKKLLGGKNQIKKFQKQLLTLARLRSAELIVKTQIQAMSFDYDVKSDGLFLEGLAEGREEGIEIGINKGREEGIELSSRNFVKNLWARREFSLSEIALLVGLEADQVPAIVQDILQNEGQTEEDALATIELYKLEFPNEEL
jgi:hypothetical protein